jgi:hypothetical protein
MLCSVIEGDEPINIYWVKDGENVSRSLDAEVNRVGHDSILRMNRVREAHMGNYTCWAHNPAGAAAISFTLYVKGLLRTL